MKKKKILIAVVCVIAALAAICLIYLWSGNSFVAEKLSSNPKARASVIEAQYKLSKKENLLPSLCFALSSIDPQERTKEQTAKMIAYSELLFQVPDEMESSADTFYARYLSVLLDAQETAKFQETCPKYYALCEDNNDLMVLAMLLQRAAQSENADFAAWAKQYAADIVADDPFFPDTEENYKNTVQLFQDIAEAK